MNVPNLPLASHNRRDWIVGVAGGLASLAAGAQSASERTTTLLVPNVAGGALDNSARLMGTLLARRLDQRVVVENIPGAGGVLAVQRLLRPPLDGQTLMVANNDLITTAVTMRNARYTLKDIAPIGRMSAGQLGLFARANMPTSTVDELVAQSRSKPGGFSVGMTGTASVVTMAIIAMEKAAGIELNKIAYKGGAQAMTDLLGGQIDLLVTSLSVGIDNVRSGKLKFLGTMNERRNPNFPDLPTVNESRSVSGIDFELWVGLVGPSAMPRQVVDSLNQALMDALRDPIYQEFQKKSGSLPIPPSSPEDFARYLARTEVVARQAAAGLKLE